MTDAYEREAMPGVGEVLFRHKVTSPRLLVGFTTLFPSTILGVMGIGVALTASPLGGLAMIAGSVGLGVLMSFLMVTFATARVAVSEGELHVQLGMAGPKIPIAEIASVKVAPSGRNKMGMGASIDLSGNRYQKRPRVRIAEAEADVAEAEAALEAEAKAQARERH